MASPIIVSRPKATFIAVGTYVSKTRGENRDGSLPSRRAGRCAPALADGAPRRAGRDEMTCSFIVLFFQGVRLIPSLRLRVLTRYSKARLRIPNRFRARA